MLIGAGEQLNGLYFFQGMDAAVMIRRVDTSATELWHNRLGHPSSKVLEQLHLYDFSSGVFDFSKCEVCIRSKQTHDHFPLSNNKTSMVFELIHCDLWGPYRTTSLCGSKYFLTILDDFSRTVWIYLLPNKKEAPKHIQNFVALVERQFAAKVKTLRSDNDFEFICLSDFFSQKGIIHETSCIGSPQQNGRVERKHRHLLNVARSLRFQASLPIEFWSYCVLAAGYLINRIPTAVLNGKTPYELLYQKLPPTNHLKLFGCLCYVHNQKHGSDKFASRTNKSVFLGYPFGKKGWRSYKLETGVVSVSRDVIFCETEFPFASSLFSPPHELAPGNSVDGLGQTIDDSPLIDDITDIDNPTQDSDTSPQDIVDHIADTSSPSPAETDSHDNELHPVQQNDSDVSTSTSDSHTTLANHSLEEILSDPAALEEISNETAVLEENLTEPEALGCGLRMRKPPTKLADYVTTLLHSSYPTKTPYPIDNYLDSSQFSDQFQAFLLSITSGVEPVHYKDAIEDENWRFAVEEEIVALEDRDTWTVVALPPGKKALGCKQVFKLKFNADGTIERPKARLVVLGNNQTEGVDYAETFAPVAKMVTLRSFLQQAVSEDWEGYQMDVHNAFLHGDLEEEVYMQFPPGFRTNDKNMVCRLHKSLYGLKQAPRCWYAKLATSLLEYGFEKNVKDHSLFAYNKGGVRIHVLIYVDDLIITGSSVTAINEFKEYLSNCFKMKDLGILRYFLGIEVARSPLGM